MIRVGNSKALRAWMVVSMCSGLGAWGCASAAPHPVDNARSGHTDQRQATSDAGEVKLLQPGAEPQQVLSYSIPKGQRETVAFTLTHKFVSLDVPLPHPVAEEPPWSFEVQYTHGQAASLSYGFQFLKASEIPAAEGTVLRWLVGQRGEGSQTAQGLTPSLKTTLTKPSEAVDGDMITLEGVVTEVRHAMLQLVTPLPKERVGVGARWQHIVKRPEGFSGPVPVTEQAPYTLTKREQDRLFVSVEILRHAESVITPANEAAGEQSHSVQQHGTDNRVVLLSRLTPLSSTRRLVTTVVTKEVLPTPDSYSHWTTKTSTSIDVVGR